MRLLVSHAHSVAPAAVILVASVAPACTAFVTRDSHPACDAFAVARHVLFKAVLKRGVSVRMSPRIADQWGNRGGPSK